MSIEVKLSQEAAPQQDRGPGPPPAPRNVEETGLTLPFISNLILKQVLFVGEFTFTDLAAGTGLPMTVLDKAVEALRREKLLEVKGTSEYLKSTYRFGLTVSGREQAAQLLDICRYTGPAPVTLAQYRRQAAMQTVRGIVVGEARVREAFAGLVVGDSLLDRLGPATGAGKPILLYGPSGNGKTTVAEAIGDLLPGAVYVPHALLVGGQLITIFDPVTHCPVAAAEGDRRWVAIKRPVVKTGGEFTLRMLDLEFNPVSRFYEAPLQVKANHGLFLVDDFGRQPVDPQNVLNRWIVALDRGIDFLALHTGMKFDVPFDQLVIFATNREPRTLMDDAFLRRIRYKIPIGRPDEHDFQLIFQQACQQHDLPYDPTAFAYLMDNFYRRLGLPHDACHARDLIGQIVDRAAYLGQSPRLTRPAIDAAWESYFVIERRQWPASFAPLELGQTCA